MFDSRHIDMYFLRSFLFPFLKIIIILAFFHVVGIRISDKHVVYSLASVFEIVSSCLLLLNLVKDNFEDRLTIAFWIKIPNLHLGPTIVKINYRMHYIFD